MTTRQLVQDIFASPLSGDEIAAFLEEAGYNIGSNSHIPHEWDGVILSSPKTVMAPINTSDLGALLMVWEKLYIFLHQLSQHAALNHNTMQAYNQYLDFLKHISPLLPRLEQEYIEWFDIFSQSSRETTLNDLTLAGLMPEQIIIKITSFEWSQQSPRLSEVLSFSGIMVYRKLFGELLDWWEAHRPSSEKIDITNHELILFIRELFSTALNTLREYVSSEIVREYIIREYGSDIFDELDHSIKGLEAGFRSNFLWNSGLPTNNLAYKVFYEDYRALVVRLLENKVTPTNIHVSRWIMDIRSSPRKSSVYRG